MIANHPYISRWISLTLKYVSTYKNLRPYINSALNLKASAQSLERLQGDVGMETGHC